MPWLETAPVEERLKFIDDARSDRFTMAELCARYGVSRRVGYKWIERFEAEGRRGLRDRSRAPHHCPHRIDAELAELLCALRRQHPLWGARKLLRILAKRHPRVTQWPAPSTVADLLARRGLVQRRSKFHAFPSGHTASSTAFFVALFLARKKIGAPLLLIPILIAISRLIVGAHYLSDVTFAAVLGVICALLVAHWFSIRNPKSQIHN